MSSRKNKPLIFNERRQELKDSLDAKRLPMAIGILRSKFVENIGGIIRTANALTIQKILMQSQVFNKAASAGTHPWEEIQIAEDPIAQLKAEGYHLIALEQHARSVPLWDYKFPRKCAIIIGHEVEGMMDSEVDLCADVIEIPQEGLVESLNVATATSIAIYEYCRQHRRA